MAKLFREISNVGVLFRDYIPIIKKRKISQS